MSSSTTDRQNRAGLSRWYLEPIYRRCAQLYPFMNPLDTSVSVIRRVSALDTQQIHMVSGRVVTGESGDAFDPCGI